MGWVGLLVGRPAFGIFCTHMRTALFLRCGGVVIAVCHQKYKSETYVFNFEVAKIS